MNLRRVELTACLETRIYKNSVFRFDAARLRDRFHGHRQLQKNWDAYGRQDPLFAIVSWAEKKNNRWNLDEFLQLGVQEIEALLAYIAELRHPLERGHALDFGCGVGRLTQALAPHFDRVSGVDIAPSMIEQARHINRFAERCQYYLNERTDLSLFPDNHFDFIYTNITLQHMEPRYSKGYLYEFLRILKPVVC
jgi:SAM-dependent methyltransferase